MDHDLLIVGAGPVGCVIAERASKLYGLKSIICDTRNHIAGNCYDTKNSKEILIHRYGPHYFRTNDYSLLNYLKKFSKFHDAKYEIKSSVNNKLYQFPINLNTLNEVFDAKLNNENDAKLFLKSKSLKLSKVSNFEDYLLTNVGKELYEFFYKNYTTKQWGISPKNLPADIAKRVPIRFNLDNRYLVEKFQVMPSSGFTSMFKNMIDAKDIKILLKTDFFKIKDFLIPKLATIYTGPIDKYFNYQYGKLGWRSINFKFETFKKNYYQKYVQINYPNSFNFTRKVEIKHVTLQKSEYTTISKDFPNNSGDPYYPINTKKDVEKYKKYLLLTKKLKNTFFIGRLAEYTYINTDQAIKKGIDFSNTKLKKLVHGN